MRTYQLRPQQRGAIDGISPGIQLWLAQTGFGKSVVAWEASKGKRAIILTHTIGLQQQYQREFGPDVFIYMGRAHTHCGLGTGAGLGTWCLLSQCPIMHCYPSYHEASGKSLEDAGCDIVKLRQTAAASRVVVTNYHAYHYSKDHLGERDILWADEAQHMPVAELNSIAIPRDAIPSSLMGRISKLQRTRSITKSAVEELGEMLERHKVAIADKILDDEKGEEFFAASHLWDTMYLNKSFELRPTYLDCRPIRLGSTGVKLFLNDVPTTVAMSGTLISGGQIGARDYEVTKFPPLLPSPEIVAWKKRAKNQAERFDRVMEAVDMHEGERGVVFFTSRKEANEFYYSHTQHNRRWILQQSPGARREVLELGERRDGVLLTYGGHEGLDLPDDAGRFGVLAKMPFLNIGDVHVKSNFEMRGWAWYNAECGLKIRQAAGRIIRHANDYGVFYLADQGSSRFPHEKVWANGVFGVLTPQKWDRI